MIADILYGTDRATGDPLGIDPDHLPVHALISGKTGSGKSVLLQQLLTSGHVAGDHTQIVIDGKGDGFPETLARCLYAVDGDLSDVVYLPVGEVVPAMGLFDVRPALEAGLDRALAVERRIDQYLQVLRLLEPNFDDAIRAEDVIRRLVAAAFDTEHGSDAFPHRQLLAAIQRVRMDGTSPPVSSPRLEDLLRQLTAGDQQLVDRIMQGAATRVEKVAGDPVLATLADVVPDPAGGEAARTWAPPAFRFGEWLGEDVTIIIDVGALGVSQQRAVTHLLVAQLWFALQRRQQTLPAGATPADVLVAIDEFATLGLTPLMQRYLAEGRGMGVSVWAAMQYPRQAADAPAAGTEPLYGELLAETALKLCGRVDADEGLADALATVHDSPAEVARMLRGLSDGEWLYQPPPTFQGDVPTLELIESPPLPPGHPERGDGLGAGFDEAFSQRVAACRDAYCVPLGEERDESEADEESESAPTSPQTTTLPFCDALPRGVSYDGERHAVACGECGRLYAPSFAGLRRAVGCHGEWAAVNRERVPPVAAAVKCTPEEIAEAPVSGTQLRLVQVVLNAMEQRYTRAEFDLVFDSMRVVRDAVGASTDDVAACVEAGLLKEDDDFRRTMYTVTPEGKDMVNDLAREGVTFGPDAGDLNETASHAALVEALRRYVAREYVGDSESPVVEARSYYAPDGVDGRLDVAGIDDAGAVVVGGEAERATHDTGRAAPADYDQFVELEVSEALWVASSRAAAHDAILGPLSDPTDGAPRLDASYATTTPLSDISLDAPGATGVFTMSQLQDVLATPQVTDH
ncbi:TraM recognition domain-containing protein [Halobaculum sp. MBLA0147]|uniref:TraM recognition domain-containing protein n=1 Tax=Halobaculum sp. MBLA0147 TaxID=3079934 RepID=UPI003525D851